MQVIVLTTKLNLDKLEVPEVTIVEEGTTFNTLPVLWSGINVPVNQWSVELWNSESGVVQVRKAFIRRCELLVLSFPVHCKADVE